MSQNLSTLFYLKKNKVTTKGLTPVYLRISLDGKRAEIATHIKIPVEMWSTQKCKAVGNEPKVKIINSRLQALEYNAQKQFNVMESLGQHTSAIEIANKISGKSIKKHSLLEVFLFHNEDMKQKIGVNYTYTTYKRYLITLNKVKSFIKYKYRKTDILLDELSYSFVTSFDLYLKTHDKNGHNTATKHITNLKKIINLARANEWMTNNPFANFKVSYQKTNREYLTKQELKAIKDKVFEIDRLEKVRDIYVFACYTGLAFSDLKKLTPADVQTGIDGNKWIIIFRKKTDTRSSIPLLDEALAIINKYKNSLETSVTGALLPVNTNQKMNGYLKEIAAVCGIKKNLTMHTARHTFATTITLTNGVPIETVSKMLGHLSIKTTQIYAKVNDTKISKEMIELNKMLSIPESLEQVS